MIGLALFFVIAGSTQSDRLEPALAAYSESVHQAFVRQGRVEPILTPAVDQAFARVQSLFPELNLKFSVLTDPVQNASSLANGHIYLGQGFIAEFRSLEDMIFVLAHEAAHVSNRHVANRLSDHSSPGSAAEVEIQADTQSLERLASAGLNISSIAPLLARLDDGGDKGVGALRRAQLRLPSTSEVSVKYDGRLLLAQVPAVALLLDHGMVEPVTRLLDDVGADLGPALHAAWRAEVSRISGDDESAIQWALSALALPDPPLSTWRTLALAQQAEGLNRAAQDSWARLLQLEPDAPDSSVVASFAIQGCRPPEPAPPTEVRTVRFGSLRLPLPEDWRIALQLGGQLVLSAQTVDLVRIDIWRQNAGGKCALDLVGLEQSLRRLRKEYRPERLRLDSVKPVGNRGLVADIHYHDRSGLHWRLKNYWVSVGDHWAQIVFRAPALNYFGRYKAAADTLAFSVYED